MEHLARFAEPDGDGIALRASHHTTVRRAASAATSEPWRAVSTRAAIIALPSGHVAQRRHLQLSAVSHPSCRMGACPPRPTPSPPRQRRLFDAARLRDLACLAVVDQIAHNADRRGLHRRAARRRRRARPGRAPPAAHHGTRDAAPPIAACRRRGSPCELRPRRTHLPHLLGPSPHHHRPPRPARPRARPAAGRPARRRRPARPARPRHRPRRCAAARPRRSDRGVRGRSRHVLGRPVRRRRGPHRGDGRDVPAVDLGDRPRRGS